MGNEQGEDTWIHGGDQLTRKLSRELEIIKHYHSLMTALCADAHKDQERVSVCMSDTENET